MNTIVATEAAIVAIVAIVADEESEVNTGRRILTKWWSWELKCQAQVIEVKPLQTIYRTVLYIHRLYFIENIIFFQRLNFNALWNGFWHYSLDKVKIIPMAFDVQEMIWDIYVIYIDIQLIPF